MRFCASLNCKKMRNANVLATSASGDQRKSEWKSQQILQFYQNNYFAQRIQLFWQLHSFQLLNDTLTLFLYLSHLLVLYPPHHCAYIFHIYKVHIVANRQHNFNYILLHGNLSNILLKWIFKRDNIHICSHLKMINFCFISVMKLFNLDITTISYETEEIAKCVHFLLSLSQWAYYTCFNKFYKYKRDFFIVEPCFIELYNWNGLKKMCVIHFK